MANMEIHYANYLNTTTMIGCYSGVTTTIGDTSFANLFDRDSSSQFQTVDVDTNATAATLTIEFDSPKNLTTIVLQNTNLKYLLPYYNSNSANKFSLTVITEGTLTGQWFQNSSTNLYLNFATTTVNSVQIYMAQTFPAVEEKKIGELWLLEKILRFTDNPSAKQFKPKINRKEYDHEMSNGGISTYILAENYSADIQRTFVTETEKNTLKTIYNIWEPIVYLPNPTGTSWDTFIYETNWIGDFEFVEYSDNYRDNGFSGRIRLRETPK